MSKMTIVEIKMESLKNTQAIQKKAGEENQKNKEKMVQLKDK